VVGQLAQAKGYLKGKPAPGAAQQERRGEG
jgi:hypothetical protein